MLGACIDPISIKTDDVAPKLVVHGLITDHFDESLNKVTLTWSEPFNGEKKLVYARPERGASVSIRNEQGQVWELVEGERGVYYLPSHQAPAAGHSYTLHVMLANGKEYTSSPELMRVPPSLDELTYAYRQYTDVVVNGSGERVEQTRAGFEVYANGHDPADVQNYYRWDAEGIFEYFSFAPDWNPPLSTQCWSYLGRINTKVVTMDDRLFNGNRYKQTVAVMPADMPTRFLIKVRQYALTQQAHEFWRLFNQQQTSVGSIFDPPPAKIRGNLYSTTDPGEEVIGFFGAAGVSEKTLLVNRALYAPFPGLQYEIPFVAWPLDCRSLFPNSTDIKPEGF
ncbi:MAG: DUF4249 domain-containing protein [Hymenobacteraceae bacterium]|nr:DUF4249 domain-containing protein [Hymenobacteraceae bacterium]